MKISRVISPLAVFAVSISLSACTTISPFSPRAYEVATSLKVDALATMDKADDDFEKNKQHIEALKLNIDKAYEYASGRPDNEESIKQWAIIKDPNRNSLGGFLKRWEAQKKLKKEFIAEAKQLVGDGFDTVIQLESGKIKPNSASK